MAHDGRCGRRRGGASGATVRAGDVEVDGRHGGHGGDTHTRAWGGGWGWSPRPRGGLPRAGCVGRGRSRTYARAGGVSGVCGRRGGDPNDSGGAAVGSSLRSSGSPLLQVDGSRVSA